MRKTSDVSWQDAQHQVLFEILEQIKQPGAGRAVLTRLREYTENHFTLEEHYMEVLDYPYREAHVAAHDQFRKEIIELLESGDEPDEVFREIISTYLTEWLKRHVFGIDKQLEQFILESGAR